MIRIHRPLAYPWIIRRHYRHVIRHCQRHDRYRWRDVYVIAGTILTGVLRETGHLVLLTVCWNKVKSYMVFVCV